MKHTEEEIRRALEHNTDEGCEDCKILIDAIEELFQYRMREEDSNFSAWVEKVRTHYKRVVENHNTMCKKDRVDNTALFFVPCIEQEFLNELEKILPEEQDE